MVSDIIGDEIGEGTIEGAGETGSEPDNHSKDSGVCMGGAGGGELHALLSDHDYMLEKTRAPAPSITSYFAANYAVGSPSMPEARQAQVSELTAQLSALGFHVSHIAPSGPQTTTVITITIIMAIATTLVVTTTTEVVVMVVNLIDIHLKHSVWNLQ
nr:nucleotide-binding, alpha-beta plait [Tanacetum cinerariifolium]